MNKNLFLVIKSKREIDALCVTLINTIDKVMPINQAEDLIHREHYTMSIASLEAFSIETLNTPEEEIYPAVLAFHSTLTEILPPRIKELSTDFYSISMLICLREINLQFQNQNEEVEAKVLINDYGKKVKQNKIVKTPFQGQ